MYKTKSRPNQKDVSQRLELEFQARLAFIDSAATKEQDRPTKILQAYPCFRELDHAFIRRYLANRKEESIDVLQLAQDPFLMPPFCKALATGPGPLASGSTPSTAYNSSASN
ncbi:serine/threonine-protein kinase tousled-like 2 isoform X2 [Salvelinus fontinalis]|uniref:serine/threonine-protein kinase tousled-like 2 isoform X2 n=1 Tax=Salvelinus fontinalis TaxID=8038 RepID=UPI0024860CD2|nr:serine/threonine-protein kinase tousled-like 2 isoform X2 [Salvelinus fontinalis]